MSHFNEFLSKKQRERKERIALVGKVLKKAGFKVISHLEDSDPFVYVKKPKGNNLYVNDLSFGGVRIYIRGDNDLCMRPQMKSNTFPFGDSYLLDIADMYRDLSDSGDKKAINKVIKNLVYVIKDFFIKSGEAEAETPPGFIDSPNGIVSGMGGSDYSNSVMSGDSNRK